MDRGGSPNVRLFVNLGTQDDLNPGKLTGWISRAGGHDVRVGRIEILKKYSYFDVALSDVATLTGMLGKAKYSGRNVRVEPVDEAAVAERPITRAERRKEQFKDRAPQASDAAPKNPSASSRSHKSGKGAKHKPQSED